MNFNRLQSVALCILLLLMAWAPLAADPLGQADPASRGNPAAQARCSIDLSIALRLAARENPTIGRARETIAENLALQEQADSLILPTLSAGGNLRVHRGTLQSPDGTVFEVSSQSLYVGGGARAIGAQTVAVPGIYIFAPLGDAWLEPLVARQRVAVASANAAGTANNILLDVTRQFLELVAASASLDALQQTRGEAKQVVRATAAFAEAGQGRKSDADRANSRALLLENEISRGEERVAVASAQLARLLHLDSATQLTPVFGRLQPIRLVDSTYDLQQLVSIALRARPEIAARLAGVAVAETRLRKEQIRPFLPTITAGFSAGTFGGGSNLAPSEFGHFGGRTDFDVLAFWTLQNLGVGNDALQRTRRAEMSQAVTDRVRLVDRVSQEVADAYAVSMARHAQIPIAEHQLAVAASGFREELARIRGGAGLPIEVLNSLELFSRARLDLIAAVVEYDQAQFGLFVALGQPPFVALRQTAPPH